MRRTGLLTFIPLLVLLASLLWSPALWADGQDGTIQGTLTNRTPGGAGVANQEVVLKTYVGDQEQGQASTKTDSQGHFSFSGLSTASNTSYRITLNYQSADYSTDVQSFDAGTNVMPWDVSVYDTTTSPDNVRISRGHLIVSISDNTITVLQYFSFVNNGDKAFVGSHPITPDGKKETIRLSIPSGATQITSEGGLDECCAFRTDDGISDTLAAVPGSKDVILSYQLPYKSPTTFLDLSLYYPVDTFNLFVEDQKVGVSSPQLQSQGVVDIGGQKYLQYIGSNLAANTELSIDLTGLSQTGLLFGRLNANTIRWSGIALVLLAIGFVVFYTIWRRPATSPVVATTRSQDRGEILLRELAGLDDRFAAGQIDPDEYERVRDKKKRRLAELMAEREDQT